jgi:hypothetical protein
MTLTIDNLTGLGPIDYTPTVAPDTPLRIDRTLNQPSTLSALLEPGSLAVPVRRARVAVTSASGTLLFTGYLTTEPVALYAGVSTTGTIYRYALSAVSDEWLLDKQPLPALGSALDTPAGVALTTLTQRAEPSLFSTTGVAPASTVGVFEPRQTAAWSANAGELAAAAYAAYRVLNGALTLAPAGSVTHALNFDAGLDASGGVISIAALRTASVKELANDVTLSGDIEPAAYISETFAGDGTTTVFDLSEAPFRPASAASRNLLTDSFNEAVIDTQIWAITDPGSHLALSGSGLTLTGGNGFDGQTTLTSLDPVEMSGSLLIEAGSVTLSGASQGILCGLYNGPVATANCFAGYNIRQLDGATVITPMINGVETGTTFTVQSGHTYTLRLRLHCPEMQRVLQTYCAMVNGVVNTFGGGSVPAPCTLVFDLIDLGAASNTPATVLYDGSAATPIATTPAACTFCAVNSVQLFGSIAYVRLTQPGSAWVVSTLPSGAKLTRLIGIAGESVDCKVSATGTVTFFSGRTPVAGEYVTVSYRGSNRAVTRVQDAASVAREAAAGAPGTARWLGKVLKPPTRSSADCESAALAILGFATSRAAAVSGTYAAVNLQQTSDVWPGDVLALTQSGAVTSVVVRKVRIERTSAFPEALDYTINFANDWAEGLGLTLSESIADDAILPLTPLTAAQLAATTVLANLPQLQLVSSTTTALQIDTGTAPPTGGGFEVRRRDGDFGPGVAQDLVLRSPVRSFSIPREAQVERYYIRMYDASTPPLYSRYSSAIFINLPIS